MSLLPLRGESKVDPGEPRVVGLDGEDADEAFEVLSATTTRRVLSFLYQQPSTPAEVRDQIGTSLQNVHYHIGKLEDAGLIEAAGTGYSEKGTEMTVYAPANEAIVLFAGRQSDRSRFKQLLSRVFGTVVALFAVAIGYAYLLADRAGDSMFASQDVDGGGASDGSQGAGAGDATGDGGGGGGGDGTEAAAEATTSQQTAVDAAGDGSDGGDGGVGIMSNDATTTAADQQTATEEAARATTEATRTVTDGGADMAIQNGQTGVDALLADPAFAFVLGGLFVLLVLGTIWAVQRRR